MPTATDYTDFAFMAADEEAAAAHADWAAAQDADTTDADVWLSTTADDVVPF